MTGRVSSGCSTRAWGGRNRAYLDGGAVDAGSVIVHGDWRLPRANRYEVSDAGGSRYIAVDPASVPARLDRGEFIYDRTAPKWVPGRVTER